MNCDIECLKNIHKKMNTKPRKPRKLKETEIFELSKHISKKPHTKKETKIMYNEISKGKSLKQAHKIVTKSRKSKSY